MTLKAVLYQGGAAWLTAEEESDRISMKETNCTLYVICLFMFI